MEITLNSLKVSDLVTEVVQGYSSKGECNSFSHFSQSQKVIKAVVQTFVMYLVQP